MERFDYLAEVKRLGGLEFTPQTPEAWMELAKVLKRRSCSGEHARRIIDRFMEPGAIKRCPTPGDLAVIAQSVPENPALDRPDLAPPCPLCADYSGAWRMKNGGLLRCCCERGEKLAAMDAARISPPVEARKPAAMSKPSADWIRRAAGETE